MILFAISWASNFAVVVSSWFREPFEEIAVRGFSSRMRPILRTISDQDIVCMSAWRETLVS